MSNNPDTVEVRSPDGRLVARARVADSIWSRLRGQIAHPLAEGHGLLLPSCSSVHTHFMSYPIDVVYLSRDDAIVKIAPALKPWRFSWGGRGANHVLELQAGTTAELGLAAGQQLTLEPAGTVAAR